MDRHGHEAVDSPEKKESASAEGVALKHFTARRVPALRTSASNSNF